MYNSKDNEIIECPRCGSDHCGPVNCWDCNGTGRSFWVADEECGVCEGQGTLDDQWECFVCFYEWCDI